jgi:RNA recognition motif-containing protein
MESSFSIYVSNLNTSTKKKCIEELFSDYGPVKYSKIYNDARGKCRGFANITFWEKESYYAALQASIYLKGKQLVIEPYLSDAD